MYCRAKAGKAPNSAQKELEYDKIGKSQQKFLNLCMEKEIKIFKSFEEQEHYFLQYFMSLTPSERLRSLAELQKKNYKDFNKHLLKKITIQKHYFADGH